MSDPIALAAFIIAIVAVFVAVSQVLQQYFATADGLRRCQPSVMGPWAKKTRLRFRWSELRFETLYAVPYIDLVTTTEKAMPFYDDPSLAIVRDKPLSSSHVAQFGELAGWVPLLTRLQADHAYLLQNLPTVSTGEYRMWRATTGPRVQVIQKSWDFMPAGVVRPLAISSVWYVAILARRLNMEWKQFDPNLGLLRAEGDAQGLTSTTVPFVGTVLQYNSTFAGTGNPWKARYIPLRPADKLGFGIVDTGWIAAWQKSTLHNVAQFDVGSPRALLDTLRKLFRFSDGAAPVLATLTDTLDAAQANPRVDDCMESFNDLVPLCSFMLASPTTVQRRLPCPNVYRRGMTHDGLFEGFEDLLINLDYGGNPAAARQTRNVLFQYQNLKRTYPDWENAEEWDRALGKVWKREWGGLIHQCFDAASSYLRETECGIPYWILVAEHAFMSAVAVTTPAPAVANGPRGPTHPPAHQERVPWYVPWRPERLVEYCARVQNAVARTRALFPPDPRAPEPLPVNQETIQAAWITMMFRAMCWQRCHFMVTGVPPISSDHWGSLMPVYFG